MQNITYEINVAYKGKHDATITVGRNGPDNVSLQTAKFTLLTMRKALGADYSLTMTEVTETTQRTTV